MSNLDKNITLGQLAILALLCIAGLLLSWIAYLTLPEVWIAVSIFCAVGISGALHFYVLNDMRWRMRQQFESHKVFVTQYVEALMNIFAAVKLEMPIPAMDGWAMSPHSIVELIATIRRIRPGAILELGSGTSTLVSAYLLRLQGEGHIVSLDHDRHFSAVTRSRVAENGLQDAVDILDAPLVNLTIDGVSFPYYDTQALQGLGLPRVFDLIVVDGPPNPPGVLSRYPAMPVFGKMLGPNGYVFLDDYDRNEEQQIVARWIAEYGLEIVCVANQNQAVVLRRHVDSAGNLGQDTQALSVEQHG